MSTRVADRVDEWPEHPFDGGSDGLARLADEEFSGVVRASDAELYLTKGVPIGVLGGDIETFDGPGTAHEAPSPALPLLAVMQAESTDVRDEFYTERTPLSEVDQTLASGGFTGYIELSENVLSGDYYVVYHAGESMSVAFLGQSGRLVEGPDAFDAADDEVGLYQVRPVTVEPLDIPRPEPDDGTAEPPETTAGSSPGDGASAAASDTAETDARAGATDTQEAPASSGEATQTDARETRDDTTEPPQNEGEREQGHTAGAERRMDDTPSETGADDRIATQTQAENVGEESESGEMQAENVGAADIADGDADGGALELRSIPSVDPDRTVTPEGWESETADSTDDGGTSAVTDEPDTATTGQTDSGQGDTRQAATGADGASTDSDQLLARLSNVERERDRLRNQLQAVRAERDELAAATGTDEPTGREISPEMAQSGATVFVRYGSQAAPTLSDVQAGVTDPAEFRENLTLDIYGGFDDPVTVEGRPYEEFVADTLAYQFVDWMLNDLTFEIQGTGNESALRDLYDALPRIDRAVLAGSVSGVDSTESFDVVLRDSRERPLVVANIVDTSEPVTQRETEQLVSAAERVASVSNSLAGAFLVTRSFFDGSALDTADEATKGKLLGRNKRKSFVRVSRKNGYHLCLLEARAETPHMAFPEL